MAATIRCHLPRFFCPYLEYTFVSSRSCSEERHRKSPTMTHIRFTLGKTFIFPGSLMSWLTSLSDWLEGHYYLSLALSSFISSTLFPGGSEAIFLWGINNGQNAMLSWSIASFSNSLGGVTNLAIGWWLAHLFIRENPTPLYLRARHYIERWGWPALLFSWVPIIGDPLCTVAGMMRMNWIIASIAIMIGKSARYGALLMTT